MPTFLRSNFLKCPIFHNFRIRYVKKLGFNLELGSNQNWIRISSYINQNKVQLKIALKILEIWKLVIEIHLGLTRLHTICQTVVKKSLNFDPVYLAWSFASKFELQHCFPSSNTKGWLNEHSPNRLWPSHALPVQWNGCTVSVLMKNSLFADWITNRFL